MPSGAAVGRIAPEGAKKKSFRPDIQGLRAIAVLVVILNHLFGWPTGGFIGVDIFFVISGFLITGLLYREHERTGRISFADFYRRRVKRIIPISTIVIVVTVAAAFFVYFEGRARTVLVDGIWALLFASNWHSAIQGTNYWADDGTVSPLQHYWSLAVEEQFYLVWPWLIVGAFAIASRRYWTDKTTRTALLIAMTAVIAISLAWAIIETATNPGFAYFSTFVRAWELGVGALIAIGAPALRRIPDFWRPILAWLGIAGMVAALVVVPESPGFPAPWALLPVLATALVIAAGTSGEQRWLFPLTNPVSRYLGDISYSLYLWHFPIIVLLAAIMPADWVYYTAVLVGTLGLSVLSYHFVEDPIRRSKLLDPRRTRRHWNFEIEPPRVVQYITLAVSVAALIALLTYTSISEKALYERNVAAAAAERPAPTASATATAAAEPETEASAIETGIRQALQATSFPEFTPPLDSLGTANWVAAVTDSDCANTTADNYESCTFGDSNAEKNVAVFGDSFAIAWLPAIRAALEPEGYRIWPFTFGQCPSAAITVTGADKAPFPECTEHQQWATETITSLAPDLVILANSTSTLARLADGATGQAAASEYGKGMADTIEALKSTTPNIVTLAAPPAGVALQECVTRLAKPSDCTTTITSEWRNVAAVEKSAADTSGTTYVDTSPWFCSNGSCPAFSGTTPIRADAGHMTTEYSSVLGGALKSALLSPAGG